MKHCCLAYGGGELRSPVLALGDEELVEVELRGHVHEPELALGLRVGKVARLVQVAAAGHRQVVAQVHVGLGVLPGPRPDQVPQLGVEFARSLCGYHSQEPAECEKRTGRAPCPACRGA